MPKISIEWHKYFWEVVPEKVDMKKHPKLNPKECERIASHRKHRLWPY